MTRRKRTLLAVGLLVVLACAGGGAFWWWTAPCTIDATAFRPPYRIEAYEGGRQAWSASVEAGSPEERAITDWLQNHTTAWRKTLDSYAPARRIDGVGFRLNFVGNVCVIDGRQTGQLYRPINGDVPDVFSVSR